MESRQVNPKTDEKPRELPNTQFAASHTDLKPTVRRAKEGTFALLVQWGI